MANDPWAVLGLEHTSDVQAVKRQWRSLAKQFHPDLCAPRVAGRPGRARREQA